MSKFIILIMALFIVLSCNAIEPDINSSNAVLSPQPTTPNINLLNSRALVWQEQSINKYSFIEKFTMTSYPPADYLAKVTIIDDFVTEIEMLDTEEYISNFGNMTEEERNLKIENRNKSAGDWIKSFGGISAIYEKFLTWNEETLKTLEKNQKIDFEVKYYEQYNFPEYLRYGVYTYKYIGDNTWIAKIGEGSIIVEISDFTILE